MTTINANQIETIFLDCLFPKMEEHMEYLEVEGIMSRYGFQPEKIEEHRQEIEEILTHLPQEFYEDGGGGWSFLNFVTDQNGELWGQHINGEQLLALALAINKAKYLLPRDMWKALPGAMPYLMVKR